MESTRDDQNGGVRAVKRSIFACEFHWNRKAVREKVAKEGLSGPRQAHEGAKCSVCGAQAHFEFYDKASDER